MNNRELYKQKMQAQLDEWKAEAYKFKAKASGVSADAQLELNKQIKALEGKLGEIADASEDAWESIKDGAESAWASLKSAFSDAAAKFKK